MSRTVITGHRLGSVSMHFRASVVSLVMVCQALGESGLVIEARSTEARYCTDPGGGISLHLRVGLEYESHASLPTLVPTFTRVSSYTLFRGGGEFQRDLVEDHMVYPRPTTIEIPKLPSWPDPQFVSRLPSGGQLQREAEVIITVGQAPKGHTVLPGTDHYIEMEIDHWPRPRQPGETLSEAWKDQGVLMMEKVMVSAPIKIHVDERPAAKPCWMHID